MLFAKEASTNEKAKNYIKDLFDGVAVFETPKPVELISILTRMASGNDIVVDFFSGSASTAESIMRRNLDGLQRKFIMVQWQEKCKEDSEAYKAGYRTIDEIGQERIKRAAAKIKAENPLFAGDLGFNPYCWHQVL